MTHHRSGDNVTAQTGEQIPEMITPVGGKRTSDGTLQPLQVNPAGELEIAGSFSVAPTPTNDVAPASITVTDTSTPALPADATRWKYAFVNTSGMDGSAPYVISLGLGGNPAVLYNGITLAPRGGSYESEDVTVTGAVEAIASGPLANLAIQTWTT